MSTSTAEQISTNEEPRNCELHGSYTATIHNVLGKKLGGGCPECSLIRQVSEERQRKESRHQEELMKINSLLSRSGVPERFKSKTFENYIPVCAAAVDNAKLCNAYAVSFDQRRAAGGGLVLCGKPGTGKTHLATAIANHAMQEFMTTTIFSSVMSVMRRVKATYSRESREKEHEAVSIYTMPDLLVLDEVGVQFGTDAEKMILFEIVNIRYQDMKPTILISNLNINALGDYIGERVIDRMREGGGAILAFDWESYRGQL